MIHGIVAGQLTRRMIVEGLVPLGLDPSTNYWRFAERTGMSYGPPALSTVPYIDNLRIWKVEWIDGDIILSNSTNSYTLESDIPQLSNLSLSFDQNGYPMVVWEHNKHIFLRWYDPVVSAITITDLR